MRNSRLRNLRTCEPANLRVSNFCRINHMFFLQSLLQSFSKLGFRLPERFVQKLFPLTFSLLFLTACGTMTGIPAHGGGKRFAVEQELISASSRAAVKNLQVDALYGKKVAVFISMIGDQGSGTLNGGRYSIDALIRGEYQNLPKSVTHYTYPTYDTTATTDTDGLTGTTQSTSVLNAPSVSVNRTEGQNSRGGLGLNINGLGNYQNETLIQNPQDAAFFGRLVQTVLFLKGIQIVPSEYADVHLFVNVDVFGTIRSRTEYHLYNAESLKSQTKIEYFAISHGGGTPQILIKPTVSAFESQYKENYILWTGPFKTVKTVKVAEPLLVDFADIVSPISHTGSVPHTGSVSYTGSLNGNEENQASELPSNEIIRDRR